MTARPREDRDSVPTASDDTALPSAKAVELIAALTGCAAFVQSCQGEWIKDALHDWATAKSELSQYVASLESRSSDLANAVVNTDREHVAMPPGLDIYEIDADRWDQIAKLARAALGVALDTGARDG